VAVTLADIALVSCVKSKRSTPVAAGDLYVSSLFRAMRKYAQAHAGTWYVLSAEHGLLSPNRITAPYERTLLRMGQAERKAWAARVVRQLEPVLAQKDGPSTVLLLSGERYREHLQPSLERLGHTVVFPLAGLAIGKRLSWLNTENAR
jgi:hypothetical protein